jgi:site-specific DNA-methyltransferase (adenine-specific)
MEYLIKTYTNEGEKVLDFTMGSGSTGVACRNLKRDFVGIELDENYFKIAEKRINEIQQSIR